MVRIIPTLSHLTFGVLPSLTFAQDKKKAPAKAKAVVKAHVKGDTKKPAPFEPYDGTQHFKGHDLKALGIPQEAWPSKEKDNRGRHGYTVTFSTTKAVLLSNFDNLLFHGNTPQKPIQGCFIEKEKANFRRWMNISGPPIIFVPT